MCTIFGTSNRSFDEQRIAAALAKTTMRGPDSMRIEPCGGGWLGFQRLAIMGLNEEGMQPFRHHGSMVVCNGEIYGFRPLKEELTEKGYTFRSDSDCEILLPLYEQYGTDMFAMLDAEFACILYDARTDSLIAARDPIGIRPMFYGYDKEGYIYFASEARNLIGIAEKVIPFPPGYYYHNGQFVCYRDMSDVRSYSSDTLETICTNIHDLLIEGVGKRLDSDAKIGYLLSGGLDSSLVCAIAQSRSSVPIETFAIGMSEDAIDLKYAREVAEYIGSHHHEILITEKDVLDSLEEVVAALGTYDITTIRASIGMYLICRAIHQTSDIRVLLTGEISDEMFGYKYTDFAPDALAFQKEAEKRIREIYMYDVLRADRCIASHSMEARVPFGDLKFVDYVMHIDPQYKLNTYGKGKYLLRHAFVKDHLLPYSILMREKAAFSDAVGHSMADSIKEYAESYYTDEQFEMLSGKYDHARPYTKESLLYRELFEKYYPGQSEMVKDFWLPNQEWEGCHVSDPSARYLSNYGESGV